MISSGYTQALGGINGSYHQFYVMQYHMVSWNVMENLSKSPKSQK